MVDCIISLENNTAGVFIAGSVLKGTIELHLDQPKKINGLSFLVYGKAHTAWSHTRTTESETESETESFACEGNEIYLNEKTVLIGHDGQVKLDQGIHRYSFACPLPLLLPGSFEAKTGHIRYTIEANLDVPWKFDKKIKVQFQVVRQENLNDHPELMLPYANEETKKYSICCFKFHPVVMKVSLPQTGYSLGQKIDINVNYENFGKVKIRRTIFNLFRVDTFHADNYGYTHTDRVRILELYGPGVAAGQGNVDLSQSLFVSFASLLTSVNYSKLIKVCYEVKVTAEVAFFDNIEMTIPITIGTIPLNMKPITTTAIQQLPSAPYEEPMKKIPYIDE
ncbi:CLUMA_CG012200, isoform A [Clunio marinus]|uniref:CLUMA_CG012200, isoform A n=1 Tax=Clunio marinus TaxID=568069 RepID=A0A1J1IEG4_9DIPT|nr:CLUMA_CG012200, isoform A [Clunio marinus]